jgi:LPS-assembly protein
MAGISASIAQGHEASGRILLEADSLVEERSRGVVTALGNVVLTGEDQIIYADELVYDTVDGRITARGNVRIYTGDEPAQLADEFILDDSFEEGIAYGFATLLENNGRAAAGAAIRRADGAIELSDAYYTACELCEDGDEAPTWRLRAQRVVRDLDDDMVYYRNARFEILGVPALYFPYFAHADPSAERKSGLLMPEVDISNRTGFSYQQPYFWALSDYSDLTIAPRIMTEYAPLLELEYYKRFYSGELRFETSFTYEQEFDSDGEFGPDQFRGHVFGDGLFDLSETWRWGFGIQAASEDTYLRRYNYSEAPEETNALFFYDKQRMLLNQIFSVGRGENFYFDVSALSFDRLEDGFDDDRLEYVTPFVRFGLDRELPYGLGDLDINLNAVNLRREFGDDYSRASLGLDWSRPVILPGGVRVEGFTALRGDTYDYTEVDNNGAVENEEKFSRFRSSAGVDVSYPFIRKGSKFDTVLTPRMAVVHSNGGQEDEVPLNEDSLSFDLNRSVLFAPVRAPGFDVFEDGTRLDAGLGMEIDHHIHDFALNVFLGRSYRLSGGDERFSEASGVFEDESDWIADVGLNLGDFEFGVQSRLDRDGGDINRIDAYSKFSLWRLDLDFEYTEVADDASARELQEIDSMIELRLTSNIDAFYRGIFDLATDEDRRQSSGFIYRDDCTDFRLYWERENIQSGNLGPSESIKFEVVFFTLGGIAED